MRNLKKTQLLIIDEIHYRMSMLKVDNPKYITGNYYTTRLSLGLMDFEAIEENS